MRAPLDSVRPRGADLHFFVPAGQRIAKQDVHSPLAPTAEVNWTVTAAWGNPGMRIRAPKSHATKTREESLAQQHRWASCREASSAAGVADYPPENSRRTTGSTGSASGSPTARPKNSAMQLTR
jgi:hypothetical protein